MTWFIKILVLIILALLGGILFSLMTNFLIIGGLIDTETVVADFGEQMTSKAVMVWLVSVVIGIVSLFIKQKWRYIFTAMPLYAPSLFAIIYALSQN